MVIAYTIHNNMVTQQINILYTSPILHWGVTVTLSLSHTHTQIYNM